MGWRIARTLTAAAALASGATLAGVAHAQFSDGYKFLEAVRKQDGRAVTDALDQPGTTIVNTRDVSTGDTAMHVVVARRDLVWMRFLHQRGANVNARNSKGETPLQLATNLRFVEGVETLLALGARVDEPNATGETPLIVATHQRQAAMARALLRGGADPRRNDNSGRSALDYAEREGNANPVLAEIQAAAKARPPAQGAVYGPSF